jgi:hypothetical protein
LILLELTPIRNLRARALCGFSFGLEEEGEDLDAREPHQLFAVVEEEVGLEQLLIFGLTQA